MLIEWFLSIKSLPNLLFGVLCLPGDQSHPVCTTDNKPSCALHLLGSFIGSRGFSSLERRPEFWVLQYVKVRSLSRVGLFMTPWTVAYQAPPFMGFSRQGYWSGLPFPSPGDLPDPGITPGSPTLWAGTLPSKPPGKTI